MPDQDMVYRFNSIATGSSDIGSFVARMQGELAAIEAEANRLRATWDGATQQAYTTQQTKWDAAADQITVLLNTLSQVVAASGTNMAARDAQHTAMFGG